MPFRDRIDEALLASILLEPLLDFGVRRLRALQIALVYDDDVGQIEHDDFLQLQPAAVIRIHHQHRQINESIFLKWHRLLARAHGLNNNTIEIRLREQRQAIVRCG